MEGDNNASLNSLPKGRAKLQPFSKLVALSYTDGYFNVVKLTKSTDLELAGLNIYIKQMGYIQVTGSERCRHEDVRGTVVVI